MRLITFQLDETVKLGAWLHEDRIVLDLASAAELYTGRVDPALASMLALIESGPAGLARARKLAAVAPEEACLSSTACRILAPLPHPTQLRDLLSFPEHINNCRRIAGELSIQFSDDPALTRRQLEATEFFDVPADYYDFPIYHVCGNMAVVGTDENVHWPTFSKLIDYELEWAVVIGKEGRQISRERAGDYIFGYTVYNAWSACDEQVKAMGASSNGGPWPDKAFANSLGPCIVTADEIGDPYALSMKAYVNGELRSWGNTSGMQYRFEDLIAYFTRAHALYPGEVIGSGTVGMGSCRETRQAIYPGDVVELEVESIGKLRNRVVAPLMASGAPAGFDEALATALRLAIKG